MIAVAPFYTLVVQRALPSQNERDKWHWSRRHRDSQIWEILFRATTFRPPVRPTSLVWVRITSLRAQLMHDDANLRGGAKGMVDALVRLGFLRDDSDEFARIRYRQIQAPKALQCTRVVIYHQEPA